MALAVDLGQMIHWCFIYLGTWGYCDVESGEPDFYDVGMPISPRDELDVYLAPNSTVC